MAVLDVPNAYTVLTLTGVGVAPYSARGLSQSLTPIPQASQLVRTINGELINIAATQFEKYRSTVSGSDQQAPPFAGVWPGKVLVTVECITELGIGDGTPDRPAVPGSTYTDGGISYFRPILQMYVIGLSLTKDEYGHMTSWQLDLEEK